MYFGGEKVEDIKGMVERITYQNEESGYGVIKVRVTGKFIEINVGAVIEAKGNFVVNKKFGKQFSVKIQRKFTSKHLRN